MRSIKTVIRENGLIVESLYWRAWNWTCCGGINGRLVFSDGNSQRDAVNNWIEIRNILDPSTSRRRSSSITSQE